MTTSIGLVSDTHTPMRLRQLPRSLYTALQGVDLILHAGDVGELWVLDQLGGIAPAIAVHGNDDSEDAQRALPYKAVVVRSGTRILLWHSHYQDRKQEYTSRKNDSFVPKLKRIADAAVAVGANVVVFGHWHIPLVQRVDGVTIINPGAVASGNVITRQLRQTVARLELNGEGQITVRHVDLAAPCEEFNAPFNLESGFKTTLRQYSESILTPELLDRLPSMLAQITRAEQNLLHPIVLRLAHRCWDGEYELIDDTLLRAELANEPSFTDEQRLRYLAMLE